MALGIDVVVEVLRAEVELVSEGRSWLSAVYLLIQYVVVGVGVEVIVSSLLRERLSERRHGDARVC